MIYFFRLEISLDLQYISALPNVLKLFILLFLTIEGESAFVPIDILEK